VSDKTAFTVDFLVSGIKEDSSVFQIADRHERTALLFTNVAVW
jgi:hypothetical protein